jgi:hypothetical protein
LASVDPQERIEELNTQLKKELEAWNLLGVDPIQVIQFNPVKCDIWLQSLTQFLADKGLIDENEFVIYFKEQMLKQFKDIRTQILEPQAIRNKIIIPDDGKFQ